MIISTQEAKRVLDAIRRAKEELKALMAEGIPCDRAKGAILALDNAELLVCTEVMPDYCDPSDIVTVRKFNKAQSMMREDLMDRVTSCPETDRLFSC